VRERESNDVDRSSEGDSSSGGSRAATATSALPQRKVKISFRGEHST